MNRLKETIVILSFSFLGFSPEIYPSSASEYAALTHEKIQTVIQENDELFKEQPEQFTKLIAEAFSPIVDFKKISKSVMGKYQKTASKDQIEKFAKVFRESLLDKYSKTLVEFKDERIIVLPSRQNNQGRAVVEIEIHTSTKIYPGKYSMYLDKNSKWKIINIMINGINLGLVFRNQFYSSMEKYNQDIDKVINSWISTI
tara:strand:- start:43472 stop:44071 length:600 start_codon:yes stop_codon:yes gene_type:complete